MELKFPQVTTLTAVANIYLILSISVIQVYAANKPSQVTHQERDPHENQKTDTQESKHSSKRSLDNYYYDYDVDLFRPSVKFESNKETVPESHKNPKYRNTNAFRPNRNNVQRPRDSERRDDDSYSQSSQSHRFPGYKDHQDTSRYSEHPQRQRHGYSEASRYSDRPGYSDVSFSQRQKPYRRQSAADRYRPQFNRQTQFSDYDYDFDYNYNYGQSEETKKRPQNLLGDFFNFLSPKKQIQKSESDLSEPSLEWLYNDIGEDDSDFFIPNNADYDKGNIDLRDPIYDFKDVIHSIRNNETRILTLKKFLSAASSFSDKAGTDPVQALTSMPLTILSILGVFYAVSAVAVLGYKYTLFTAGSSNGQAVALIPVAILFTIPLIAAAVFVTARSTMDGKISLTRLARGDQHWLRPDFDSIDFMYDVGVGATALLGMGWIVSIAL